MRILYFSVIILFLFTVNACRKKVMPTPTLVELLSSGSSKTWQIEKIYINDTLLAMTPEMLNYKKTYKSDSSFFDSDAISGKYKLTNDGKKLEESLIIGGSGTSYYNVEVLTASQLVLKLTSDGTNSYSNKFYFRAK